MQHKQETHKISNTIHIAITKSTITKAVYTKQILVMHYVEYKNTYDQYVNKYEVSAFKISLIITVKNELGSA
jgi:hypothetical protein